jgi:tetratricopeptide (TPR) repeat protein
MNPRVLTFCFIWISAALPSTACGPFFPDNALDNSHFALEIPPLSYRNELCRMAGHPLQEHENPQEHDEVDRTSFSWQVLLEAAQLRLEWREMGLPEAEIERRLVHYNSVRHAQAVDLNDASLAGFPMAGDRGLAARPLGEDFPAEVADYVEGARLLAVGDKDGARAIWKSILDRPIAEKKLRGTWAAWMLAKTSTEIPECLEWYERVEKEVAMGAIDLLGIRAAAKSWRGPRVEDPIEGLRLSYEGFQAGRIQSAVDVRSQTRKLVAGADPNQLSRAAADPTLRKLVNLYLFTTFHHHTASGFTESFENEGTQKRSFPDPWLEALEIHATLPLEEGAQLAWSLYAMARYTEARRWLDLSAPGDPLAEWLHAKFDLRAGNLESAGRRLSQAISSYSKEVDWKPDNLHMERWSTSGREVMSTFQGKLMADAGVVAVARQDYTAALDLFRLGGYDEDAAYLAERVLTTEELMEHVSGLSPEPKPDTVTKEEYEEERLPFRPWTSPYQYPFEWVLQSMSKNDRLRYQLARRLAREGRLAEAATFMPEHLQAPFQYYLKLDRARKSQSYRGTPLAAILWHQAWMHREWGTRLFSTDGAPDGGLGFWSFPAVNFAELRTYREGWYYAWENGEVKIMAVEDPKQRAVPLVTEDEVSRGKKHALTYPHRYHYRYVASDLAWKASQELPDNDPQLPALCNTAGWWTANRDPKFAERFYHAMVRRGRNLPEGKEADVRRWFLPDLMPLGELASFPDELSLVPAKPE